jgi:hypothetical protein
LILESTINNKTLSKFFKIQKQKIQEQKPKKVAARVVPAEPTFQPKINYRSKSIISRSDYTPIYERLDKEISRRYTKLTLMKEEFELS